MEYYKLDLDNKIRIIHKYSDSFIAHLGIYINVGSRDEYNNEEGLAHFIEHTFFKGTKRRNVFQLLSRMENVGGEVNAFTTKEETCIYISFLPRYYKRAAELLADVLFNSIFPYKEIEKEKDVIIDEIHSYKDDPQELIYDEFEELLFAGHSLSHSILGEPEIIKSFSKNKIINFIKRNYVNQNIVICSVGKIKFNNLVHILQKYFLQSLTDKESNKREFFQNKNSKFIVEKIKNVNHSHCIIGSIAYNNKDKKRIPFTLVDNFLGGPTMTSRLSLQIREKYGYSYNIYSSYIPFCDTGVFNIYFSCENENVNKIIELIRKELNKLCEIKLGPIQLLRAKNQLMGQIAISLESNLNEMLSIGKSLIVFDKVDPIDKIFQKIENITASDILEVSNEILRFDNLSILIYKAN